MTTSSPDVTVTADPPGPVLVTGATAGLGQRVALELAARGATVVIGGRRPDAIAEVARQVTAAGGTPIPFTADLADLTAVRAAIDELLADLGDEQLGGIVANAGLSVADDLRTIDGFELTFGVNVLAHQLLLGRLAPHVADGGRVVIVSSGVHDPENRLARRAGVPAPVWVGVDAMAFPDRSDRAELLSDTRLRYSNSKLANVLQARELQRRLRAADRSIDVFAIDPGLMVDTEFARSYPKPLQLLLRLIGTAATPFVGNMRRSPTSARHVLRLLTDANLGGRGFAYFDGDHERPPSPDAQRDELADELWREANELVGLPSSTP